MTRIFDLHNDAATKLSAKRFLKYINAAEADTILAAVWTTKIKDPIKKIKEVRGLIDKAMKERAKRQQNTKVQPPPNILLHIEDAWFIRPENIDEVIAMRPFSVGLVWNQNNALAGGALADERLTDWGCTVIKRLLTEGIRVDLAHLNRQSFWDVMPVLRDAGVRPLCTHTCFDAVCPHLRNLNHDQIKAVVGAGGLIGLTLVDKFLTPKGRPNLTHVADHIEYFVKNFGADNLAIGTDFYGAHLPNGLTTYHDFENLASLLNRRGLSNETIEKIFVGNARKFFSIL